MIKSKNKILITLGLIAVLMLMLAVVGSAKEITVTFYNGDKVDESFGNKGEMLVDSEVGFTLPNKEVESGYSFVWYTTDGRSWSAGAHVKFDEDTDLKQAVAQDVSDFQTFKTLFKSAENYKIRLIADITVTEQLSLDWYARPMVFMNGHTINITGSHERGISGQRAGPSFYGVGDINFNTTHSNPVFAYINSHSYRGNESVLFIGRGVTVNASKATLLKDTDAATSQGYPHVRIYGKVDCKTVMNIGNTNDRQPNIDINEGAQLIVRSKLLENSNNTIKVNVRGGTIIMESSDYSFFREEKAKYTFTGGNIVFAEETDFEGIKLYIDAEQYKVLNLTASGITYQCIVPYTCGQPGQTHSYILESKEAATCCTFECETYKCQHCGHIIEIEKGSRTDHDFQFVESKPATKTELGWEKSACTGCQSVEFVFVPYDPTNDEVVVVVNTGSGEEEVKVAIKDIYKLTKQTSGYIATDVLAFGEYTLDQIVRIYIPLGIASVNLATENTYIKEVIIDDDASVTIASIAKLTTLDTITIKKCTVTFNANCAPTTLTTINSLVEGASVTFAKEAFTGKTNVSALNMCSGSSYSFAQDSFKKTNIKKLTFPDGGTYKFVSVAAFYESGVEELYLGTSLTTFGVNQTFENCNSLKRIIIMGLTTINDNTFKAISADAVVYHHASSLSCGNNAFANNTNITIYTKTSLANGAAFNGCSNYTIHYGIPHAYTRTTSEATCTSEGGVKYVTDCPCGYENPAIYKLFTKNVTSSDSYEVIELLNETTPMLAHNLTVLVGIRYDKGYTFNGTGVYKCSSCQQSVDEAEPNHQPIVKALGYSTSEVGAYSISSKYMINRDSLSDYININGTSLEIGVTVGLRSVLGISTPLSSSGTANKGAMKKNLTGDSSVVTETIIKGIPEDCLDDNYIICIYIIDNGVVNYVQSNATVENPSGVNYNELHDIASSIVAPLPTSKEDE
ncbi:MAG: leucine-rich repeat protein [Clostridia bacterium]|nr:leucine-rich repeat protein [Clostridia bacterium]